MQNRLSQRDPPVFFLKRSQVDRVAAMLEQGADVEEITGAIQEDLAAALEAGSIADSLAKIKKPSLHPSKHHLEKHTIRFKMITDRLNLFRNKIGQLPLPNRYRL